MSTQYRPLIVGLVSPGLFWLAASAAQGQGSPSPQGRPSNPAPASSATYSVLLMSNGRVVRGEIVDDPAGGVYRLKTTGGQVPYPRSSVKRAGQSIEELYRYQVEALPVGDVDERIKLVRWCLTEKLVDRAREQLAEVLRLCPDDAQAKLMAASLDADAENRGRDNDVRRTSVEVPQGEAPATLPPGLANAVPKHFGNALPEIFDLPPALAVRRASEFAEYVQPVLQNKCTTCHNEKYEGEFQLVTIRSVKDRRNPDIARANLDAVLRLVNPDDPTRSDILAAGLVPHGPKKGPIFTGANDRQYQILAAWVKSVRPKAPAGGSRGTPFGNEGVSRAGYAPPEAADGFASDKAGRPGAPAPGGAARDSSAAIAPPGTNRRVNEFSASADFSGGAAKDFPEPFDFSARQAKAPAPAAGKLPQPAKAGALPALPGGSTPIGGPRSPDEAATGQAPAVVPTEAQQVAPGVVAVEVGGRLDELPGMNQPKYRTPGKPKDPAAVDEEGDDAKPGQPKPAAPPKKKVKVDPALLEQMIKARNAANPAP